MSAQINAIAVPLALVAAASFGASGVLQQHSTHQVRDRGALRFGLLIDLLRQPLWLLSLGLDFVGAAAQAGALATGSVALVQPLLVTSLLFAVLIGAWGTRRPARRRPDRIVLFGAILCCTGLAAFLGLAQPYGGTDTVRLASLLPLAIAIAVVLAVCLGMAARFGGQVRALCLAMASGILYGVTAGLAKLVLDSFSRGFSTPFTDWPLYVLIIVGLVGFLLNQNAFQSARTLAPVLAVITILDPVVAVAVGIVWLDERLESTPLAIAGELLAMMVMALGVVVLARRSPQATK